MNVAVIIANHDYADLLPRAIASVEAQTAACRLLVVEDGPRDGVGPSGTRNTGIRAAWDDADVFAFLDADDAYRPERVRRALGVFARDPNVGLVYSDEALEDAAAGRSLIVRREPFDLDRLAANPGLIGGDYLVTKAALGMVGLFDESMRVGEMHDLALRIGRRLRCVHIPEVLLDVHADARALRHAVPAATWHYCGRLAAEKASDA